MSLPALEVAIRSAAFSFLDHAVAVHGQVLPCTLLARDFAYRGETVHLIGQQGIFKPRQLILPISVTTAPRVPGRAPPYDDRVGRDGIIRYRYRGTDPMHPDNVGLRRLHETRTPLIYFYGIDKGLYLPSWPVFVVADRAGDLAVELQVDDPAALPTVTKGRVVDRAMVADTEADLQRRRVVTVQAQRRLHQERFRHRVLRAYRTHCAVCRLRHRRLLDAAHIIPDSEGGEPVVPNGISLCKLHHGAFDANLLGIRPDLVIEIRRDVLDEEDGPGLRYGLQEVHGSTLIVPRSSRQRPSADYLETRYERFRTA